MSVIVKDMEMPTSCGECDLCVCYVREDGTKENYRCPITLYIIHNFDERHKHCPLVEVPTPHGRLIDADALKQKKKHSNEFAENIVSVAEIDWMPTIIEEEGE